MPKIPYKTEKGREDSEDYEIVSFEDFCDKPPGTKTDLLTLNDNINYRLHYESDKCSNFAEGGETSTRDIGMHTETSLNGPKNASYKRKLSFAPFGRTDKNSRGPLFSGVIPKTRNEGESREHRYERFSPRRGCLSRSWQQLSSLFPGMVATALLCALCVGAWWTVGGALGGGWGDDHYRRLYERTHADDIKKPLSPIIEKTIPTENRYHDHNNLSTKNKNITDWNLRRHNKKKITYTNGVPDMQCEEVTDNMRFDCYPQSDASEEKCAKRGCCWAAPGAPGAPYCFYPPRYETYRFRNSTETRHGLSVHYTRSRDTGYSGQMDSVLLAFSYLSDSVLHIKISDPDNRRFEPPYPEVPQAGSLSYPLRYRVLLDPDWGGFRIERTCDNSTIMDTQDVGGFIMSDKFLQLSSLLPTDHVYGLGEKQAPLMNNFNWNTFTLFNRDLPPTENKNLYGSHPFYLALEDTGKSHGVLLLNSNAMDIVLQPTPAITYRVVGGVLQLFVLLGPEPQHVLQQLTGLVGRPFMPPYWALGFHLSKFNYGSLNVTRDVMQKNIDAGIPLDAQWNDLDYMRSGDDFTYDPVQFAGLPQFVQELHQRGLHYVVLVDPGVSASEEPGSYPPFDRGLEMDVFVKNSSDQPFVGKVWNPTSTVWPDFTHPNASSYWKEMLATFHRVVPFDGVWIDMNEPSNFLSGSLYGSCAPEELPYVPAATPEGLHHKTLCMEAKHYAGPHYDVHNIYALAEAIHTFNALSEVRGRRPFVLSRASSPGLGRAAAHWGGDVYSKWHDLQMSVPALLSFSLFGIPMMGSDICGFIGDTTEDLCVRWSQLGAFYPFSRNHNTNDAKPQDPVSLGPRVVAAARGALRLRYRLLPYYYTLFWNAHVRGDTVVRPLFFEFPNVTKVHTIDEQFLVGPYVMVNAILRPGNTTTALFPECPWYSLKDGRPLARDQWKEIGEDDIASVRLGAILPLQEPPTTGPVNTAVTRSAPLQLLVAPGTHGQATGQLYWDDGDSINTYEEKKYSHIDFISELNELRNIVRWWGYGVPSINSISILGQKRIDSVTINDVPTEYTYSWDTQVVTISGINLALHKPFSVKWTYYMSSNVRIIKNTFHNNFEKRSF